MEIERKFLVKTLPEHLETYPHKHFTQGYLTTDNPTIRVRAEESKTESNYFLTYKGRGLMAREEYNLPLSREAFETLLKKADGIIIEKTRYFIPIETTSLTVELDLFEKNLKPLILAEVEFPSEEEANHFNPLDWFAEDVTYDAAYHNATMSRIGLPNACQ